MEPEHSRVDALCQLHGYPEDVRSLFRDVLAAVLVPGVRSVVLSGSGSRGELVYAESASGMRWFSDLEMTVVADDLPSHEVAGIEARLAALERSQLAIGARTFHIDVDFNSLETWQELRQNFQAWETRETGFVLFGEDVRDQIRVEVDSRTCIQSSLNRLWHLLLYLPESVLRAEADEEDREVFRHILNRAIHDFPLWFLIEEGKLVAGFAGRLQFLEESCDALSTTEFDVRELVALVRDASRVRNATGAVQSDKDHYDGVLSWYVRMLQRSIERPDLDEENFAEIILQEHAKIYPAVGSRRKIWESKLALEIAMSGKPIAALRWFGASKQATITAFLWGMHQAAQMIISSDLPGATSWLRRASGDMHELWPKDDPLVPGGDHADAWVELRRRFFDFVVQYYRGLQSKRSYYDYLLGSRNS